MPFRYNPLTGDLDIVNSSASDLYPVTPYVVGPAGFAPYQTIQAALDAANAAGGGIVLVQPGDYSENLTLYDACHVLGLTFADAGGGVNITGKHTPPAAGGFVFRNVHLISATHVFDSAVAGTAHIVLSDALVNVTNGYTFNLPNWTGKLESFDVNAAVGTNDGYINNSGGSEVDVFECSVGSGATNVMTVSGFTLGAGANFYCPINFSTGTFAIFDYSTFSKALTFSGTSQGSISGSRVNSGASTAITMSSSGDWEVLDSVIETSSVPAIDGAGIGSLTLSGVVFLDSDSLAGTLTLGSASFYPAKMDDGELLIGSTGNVPVITTLTEGSGISITNGAGAITISSSATHAWTYTSSNVANMVPGTGYVCISPGGALTLGLPSTSAQGDIVKVALDGATSFQITQAAGQQVRVSSAETTAGAGGSITSTAQGCSIELLCITANLRWMALTTIGNFTVV